MADQEITRKILNKIDNDPAISQKRLAEEIGISVGMINWHVKRCVGKGLIKLQQAPIRRYLYYLTPEGFVEKAKLTASYLQSGFDIFRTGRKQYDELFHRCQKNGWSGIVLFGDTELTELALLVAARFPSMEILSIFDKEAERKEHCGIRIVTSPRQMLDTGKKGQINVVIACHYLASIDEFLDRDLVLGELGLDQTRFLIPEFLK
jgi:DNA-binding Lrp family transcriptional regulator